jgi:uncharacterized protein
VTDLLVALVGVLAGAIAALSGFGIGSLLTPVFALQLDTKLAVAAVSIPHLIGTALRFSRMRKHVAREVFLRFGVPSAIGGLAGAFLHNILGSPALEAVFGGLLVFAGAAELTGLSRRLRFEGKLSMVAGTASGLFGGLVGNQGGIRSAALLRYGLTREEIVATATAIALLVDGVRMPVYALAATQGITANLRLIGVATAGVVLGTLIGTPLLRRLPEQWFKRAVALLLIGLGAYMLVRGAAR